MSLQGIHEIKDKVRPTDIELIRRDYAANGGWETFLAYEDPEKDVLVVSALRIVDAADADLLPAGSTAFAQVLCGGHVPPRAAQCWPHEHRARAAHVRQRCADPQP